MKNKSLPQLLTLVNMSEVMFEYGLYIITYDLTSLMEKETQTIKTVNEVMCFLIEHDSV